ncbi:DUF4132 domain-containing protein [Thermomonospora catenispora]|uniref:DUF4132 domain-containing protein n=1 Tax=Thermomonospora catenispora TaxID=2493090 RepID=UPI00111EE521|nr:DUF4132 domain-containing protein [Thermomonospora catenispora]TNY37253.1 DUF4132 domain-containing protein [Thermomonospora catenispora]
MEDRLLSENKLAAPQSWLHSLHPRRGGVPVPTVTPNRRAVRTVRTLIEETGEVIRALLEGRDSDPALSEAARRHHGGEPDPAGAAAIAALAVEGGGLPERESRQPYTAFLDAWVIEHGLPFAVCALAELDRTRVRHEWIHPENGPSRKQPVGVERGERETSEELLRRARTLLAQADEPVHREAVDRLARYRDPGAPRTLWLASYLTPTRVDWMDECCARPPATGTREWRLLCHSVSAPDHLTRLGSPLDVLSPYRGFPRPMLVTLADGLGADLLPFLLSPLQRYHHLEAENRRLIYEVIAALPSDEAFTALMERSADRHARAALRTAAQNFPLRALRLLATAETADARALLAELVAAERDLAKAALPELPEEVRRVVEPLTAAPDLLPDAPPQAVPAVLTERPWRRPSRPVITGLEPPAGVEMVWADGEREEWLAVEHQVPVPADPDWEELAQRVRRFPTSHRALELMVHGPQELVRSMLADWQGYDGYHSIGWLGLLIARYGREALPVALRMAERNPQNVGDRLLPFRSAEVALLMAAWLAHGKKGLDAAEAWLDRHGTAAVPLLVPAALDKPAKRWRPAEAALRHIADRHGIAEVVHAARAAHGDEAADAVEAVLRVHPACTGLVKPAKIGDWVRPAALPQVLLRDRRHALPAEAVQILLEALALPVPYGMEEIKEACAPDSLAEFGWALFTAWRDHGGRSADGWAFRQLGRTGDDETARRLTPVIRAWPGEGGHKHAVTGLDVLAEIGTETALLSLNGIAEKVKFKGLREAARRKIRQVADSLGLSTDQLADRLVPAFGLDPDGTLTLDYGPRRFTVGFDEQLKPYVTDESGKRRKTLPKPGAKDDPQLAPAAHKRFTELKKDVRTVASTQVRRLERAMVLRRRWTPEEFRELFVEHPLVWHIARRLVWLAETGEGATAFRIAEDRTLADAEDETLTLPAQATVGIAHPIDLGEDVPVWSEVFADYEIVQPFPQLMRQVHALTDEERTSGRLPRFEGVTVPGYTVLGLTRRGWERGAPLDNGVERWISKPVPGGLHVVIDLDPGIWVGVRGDDQEDQTLDTVWINDRPDDFWSDDRIRHSFGELDPVTASEVLADLAWLAGHAR